MDSIDQQNLIWRAGHKAGVEHSQPSPITHKLIKNMEDKFDNLKEEVYGLKTELVKEVSSVKIEIIKEIQCMKKDIEEKADQKYAPAWVESGFKLIASATILAVLGSLLSLVIK